MAMLVTRSLRLTRAAVVIAVLLSSLLATFAQAAPLPHPRIWLNSALITRMQTARTNNTAEWQALQSYCDSHLGTNMPSGYEFLDWYGAVMNYGLAYRVSGNASYGSEGVKYLTALLRDRNTIGDGAGGTNAITVDSGYVARDLGTGVAVGRDWLDGASGMTTSLINECATRLTGWITWYNSNGYARTDPTDNYYAGYFTMVYTASIGLEGDSGYQSSWQTQAESMWSTSVLPFMMTGAGAGGNWLQGWNYGPWSAREYLGYPFALETGTTRDNHWSQTNWASALVMDQVHMLYPSRAFIEDAGCWSGNYKGDPRYGVCQMCSIMSPNSATVKGLAVWFTHHLLWTPGAGSLQWETLLYTDPSVAEVAPTVSNMGGLSYLVYGHGVARSADWSNLNATFVGVEGEPIDGQGESGLHTGEVKIGSRGHILLIDGRTYEYTSDLASVPDITGSHLYAPLQGWWHDAVTYNMDNVDSAYTYFKVDNMQGCYGNNDGTLPDVSYMRRDVAFLRPDFVAVLDTVNTVSTSNLITEKWYTAGQPTINSGTASITLGGAKLFTNTVNPTVSVTSAANSGSRTPGYDPNEGFSGVYKVLISPSTPTTSNSIMQLFETADSTQGSMTAYDKLTPTGFLGASIKHATNPRVVLFATGQSPHATSCSFTFTPVAYPTKVLITGMQASTNFSVTVTGTTSKTVTVATGSGYTSTANGSLSFDVTNGPSPLTITTTTLPADTLGIAYNQTLAATGGTTPYTWAISSGSLPTGLSLVTSTGAITGTPSASGTSNFTARVTDNVAATATQALSIVVNAAVTITTSSLPNGSVGASYSQTMAATGGTGALTWSLQSGSLPAGLSLVAGTGAITGTPTASGTSNFTAKATDTLSATGTKALSIIVTGAALTITTSSLPADTVGIAYNQTLAAAGGTTPYTWSIASGTLPTGLSLNTSTGAITGTPSASGTSNFTARVTDNVAATATKALSIVVNAAPSITTSSLPGGTVGTSYSQTLAATGGTTPLTWAISSGSLPAGLSLVAGTGAITGTPTASGTSNFTARVTDSLSATATKALSITVAASSGTTYYVATNGSDSNNGSSGSPWLTLQYAVAHIASGDTIIVRDGTYTGCRIDTLPGASGAIKYLKAEHHLGAILNAKSGSASHDSVIELEDSDYWDIEDFKVNATGFTHAIDMRTSGHVTVRNCETYGSGTGTLFTAFCDYELVEGNVCHNAVTQHGFYASNSADYGTGRLNTCYSNSGCGIQLNADVSMGGDGIMSYWLVEKNTIYGNNTGGGAAINLDGACDSKFLNNLLYNNHRNGVAFFAIDAATGSARNLIYNDTIQNPSDGSWCINIATADQGTNPQDNKIKNCILMNDHATRGSIITYSSSMGAGFQSDYNAVLDRFSVDQANETVISLATWRSYGYDAHSFITTKAALFVDPTNNDYHLKAGSPAINTGTTVTEVTDDIAGIARPQGGAYDVGCYESLSSTLTITTSSLPADTVGVSYNQTLAATGGTTPYTWSIQSGSLPAGLSLTASTGAITGTPTASGTSSFTARVTDNVAATATKALSIVVNAAVTITTASLPADTINVAYNQTLAATGGTGALTWAISSGSLPTGLSLNGSTGAITGTPTASGTSSFTARATDTVGATNTKALSIVVNAAPSITTSSLPNGNVGVAYSQTMVATGGTSPLTWAISSGSLPAGLSLVASTGAITGTPTASGTSSFTARVTDNVGATATKALSIVVTSTLAITTSSLPATTVGATYNQTLTATGGATPYTWAISSGSLPAGLSLVAGTGAITGTPTAAGTSSFTARVTDNASSTATRALSIVVNAAISITTASLPADTVNIAYSQTLAATGGTGALTWSLNAGTLPTGLSLTSGGVISGTPTAAGTSSFTVKATDTVSASATKALSIVVNAAISITTASLPADTINVAYSQTLAATGGTGALTWSLNAGSLPTGLSLTSGGAVSGTPTATGTSSFTVKATDTLTASATKALSIVINAAPSITTASLPTTTVGATYNQTLAATGGTTPYAWSISSGSLPAGLSLVAGTGAITGTPTTSGTSSFTARVTDNVGATATKALSIAVSAAVTITTASLPADTINIAYNQTLAATGGTGALTWAIQSGTLPAGLSLNTSTGAITGTPTAAGTSSFTARATDTVGASGTKALSIVINAAVTITTASLPAGSVGTAYNQTMAATGGTGALTWAISSGSLPAGLSLVAGTGVISGTPTTSGTSSFTARATDTLGATGTKALSIVINASGPQTYYVSTTGSDTTGNGSSGNPWATIQKGVDTMANGDTVIVTNGNYAGFRARYSGASGAVKTVRAQNPLGAVITSAGTQCTTPCYIEVKNDTPANGISYWVVDGFETTGSANNGLEMQYGDHVTVQNCKIHNSAAACVSMQHSNYCTLSGDEVYSPTGGSGFYVGNSGDNNTVVSCIAHNCPSNGFFVTSDDGVGDRICSGWTFEKNTSYTNAKAMTVDGLTGSMIRNNLTYGQNKGIYLIGYESLTTSNTNRILGNTLVCTASGTFCVYIHKTTAGLPEGTNNNVLDNILYNYDTTTTRGSIEIDTAAMTGFQSDYNVVMNYFGINDGASFDTLAQWRALGYDTHSIQATAAALFVNAGGNDYHLNSTSPAKNVGTTLADCTNDKEGITRPQGSAYDMGCYEYH